MEIETSTVFVSIFYSLILTIGLIGNLLVIISIIFYWRKGVIQLLILNLAVVDTCFLLSIPCWVVMILKKSWIFGRIGCKLYFGVLFINQIGSSLFILILSVVRYVAVCYPLKSKGWISRRRAFVLALITWIVLIALALPGFIYSDTAPNKNELANNNMTTAYCNIYSPDSSSADRNGIIVLYWFTVGFAIPMLVNIVVSTLIVKKIKSSDEQWNASNNESGSSGRNNHNSKIVTKTVLVINLVYILCWTPYWALQIIIIFFVSEDVELFDWIPHLFYFTDCLAYSNSAINPILYTFLSQDFKNNFAKMWRNICYKRKVNHPPEIEKYNTNEMYKSTDTEIGSLELK